MAGCSRAPSDVPGSDYATHVEISFREVLQRLQDVHEHEVGFLYRELQRCRVESASFKQDSPRPRMMHAESEGTPLGPPRTARPEMTIFAMGCGSAPMATSAYQRLRTSELSMNAKESVAWSPQNTPVRVASVASHELSDSPQQASSSISFGDVTESMRIGRWKPARQSDRVARARMDSILTGITTDNRSTTRKLAENFAMAKGWVASEGSLPKKRLTARLLNNTHFDSACSIVIILNAIMLGVSTDIAMQNLPADPDKPPVIVEAINYSFTLWFLMELIIRITGHGPFNFFCVQDVSWNLFDSLVVSLDVVSTAMGFFQQGGSSIGSLSSVRMLRVLRVARALRIVKMLRFFKDLRMMVNSIILSFTSLFWSIILLTVLIFVFAILIMQGITYHIFSSLDGHSTTEHELQDLFGSMVKTAYLLFLSISNGNAWGEVCDLLLEVHWSMGLLMCFYIFFTVFAMLNIITGVFVDTALASSQKDTEDIIQDQMETEESTLRKLKSLFETADKSQSGFITKEEFEAQLEDTTVRHRLKALELELNEARGIFSMLDIDGSGSLSIEEFVFGLMRMKGGARTIDLATLQYENMRMMDTFSKFFAFVEFEFKRIEAAVGILPPPPLPGNA